MAGCRMVALRALLLISCGFDRQCLLTPKCEGYTNHCEPVHGDPSNWEPEPAVASSDLQEQYNTHEATRIAHVSWSTTLHLFNGYMSQR